MASTNEPWRAAPQLDRVPGRPDVTCLCVLAFATGARDRPPPRSWRRRARHVGAARRSDRLGNGVLRQAGPGATYCRTSCPRRNSRRRGSCMRWPRAAPVVEIPAGTGCAVRTRRKRGKPCSTRLATGSPCLTLVAGCRAALADSRSSRRSEYQPRRTGGRQSALRSRALRSRPGHPRPP